jgi:hypothetical protein
MSRNLTTQSPTTVNTIPVVSNNGFSAGDLVYQKNGSVDTIPNGLVTTGTFNINSTVNVTNANTNANILSATGGVIGGGSALGTPIAAKLSNDNIVYVFISANGSAYFRIADENNTDVVPATLISASSYALEGIICVCALPAGGFAVAFTNSSYQVYCAVYTNTGAVTLAPTLDTSAASRSMTIAARSSGQGFVLVVNDPNTASTRYKVFSDTGTQTIAWTSVAGYYSGSAQYCPGVAVRSDNSFVVGVRTGANIYRYYVYSSAGTAGVNGTINSTYTTNTGGPHFSMTCMTTGANVDMVYFLFIEGSANLMVRQTLSASNVLGSETTLFDATTCEIQAISTGGYVITYAQYSSGALTLKVYNSANSNTATTVISGAAVRNTGSFNNFPSLVEMANNYVIAFSFAFQTYVQNYNTVLAQVNKTTNLVRNFNQPTLAVASATSGVNSYSRGASTPNSAYFVSNTTATLSKTVSSGSVANILLASVGTNSVQAKGLPNGNVFVVYSTSSTVVASVYTSAGVFVTSFTVASGLSSPYAKLCVLSNGKIVIGVGTSNSIVYYVYSSTFSLLTSASHYPTVNATYMASGTSNQAGFDMAAMGNGRFVVGFGNTSNQLTYSVITDTLTDVSTNSITSTYYQNPSVAATPGGSFIISGRQSGGALYFRSYLPTSSSTFVGINAVAVDSNGMTSSPFATQMATTAQGFAVTPFFSNSTGQLYTYDGSDASVQASLYSMQASLTGVVGVTTMPSGQVLSVYFNSNASSYTWYLHNVNGQNPSSSSSGTLTLPYTPASTPQMQVAAVFDNVIAITYTNSSGYPILRLESVGSQTYTTNVTAEVTPTSVPGYTPSQSNGYIFKGVAVASAPAGGTGVVQNVGQALLNSNYPANTSYQAFDSTGALVKGTKGTIIGRNVNMTGTE